MDKEYFISEVKKFRDEIAKEKKLVNLFLDIVYSTKDKSDYYFGENSFAIETLYTNFDFSIIENFPYSCSMQDVSYKVETAYRMNDDGDGSINIRFKRNNAVVYDKDIKTIKFVYKGSSNPYEELIIFDNFKIYRKIKSKKNSIRLIHADLNYISKIKNSYTSYGWSTIRVILDSFSKSNPLFRDICSEFEDGNIYLPITLNEIWECGSKKDLIERHCKNYDIPKSINKYPLSFGYIYVKSQRYCNKEEHQKLLCVKDEFIYNLSKDGIYVQVRKLYSLYYLKKLECSYTEDFTNIIEDYIYMIWQYGKHRKFNLKIKSRKRLLQEHDDISNKKAMKSTPVIKIPKDSKFNKIKLPKTYERIKTRNRLFNETIMQNNCVWSYADRINKDKSAIYSTIYKDTRYTIEIIKGKKGFIINQVYGPCNTRAPKELVKDIITYIEKANKCA